MKKRRMFFLFFCFAWFVLLQQERPFFGMFIRISKEFGLNVWRFCLVFVLSGCLGCLVVLV